MPNLAATRIGSAADDERDAPTEPDPECGSQPTGDYLGRLAWRAGGGVGEGDGWAALEMYDRWRWRAAGLSLWTLTAQPDGDLESNAEAGYLVWRGAVGPGWLALSEEERARWRRVEAAVRAIWLERG